MLWQLAYTELHVTPVLWPDFDREHLFVALDDFQRRERRFGRVAAS
jgi:undecaprenyl diphosphate synthase